MQYGTKCSLCRLNKKITAQKKEPPPTKQEPAVQLFSPFKILQTRHLLYSYRPHTQEEFGCMKSHADALLHLRVGPMVSSFSCNLWQMLKFRAQHHNFN